MAFAASSAFRTVVLVVGATAVFGGDIDVGGRWTVTNVVETTSYAPYRELQLVFRIELEQEGAWVFGRGEKWSENGHVLPPARRTPISLAGTLDGDRLTLRFVEAGKRRKTGGDFHWTITGHGRAMTGRFTAAAADARGRSEAIRAP